jgi:hypothetical protein
MIAVDALDGGDVSSTEFSVWQSPISGVLRGLAARDADFSRCLVRLVRFAEVVYAGYVQFALAVVDVDDSNSGDEEVIST